MKIIVIIPCFNEENRLDIKKIIELSQVPELELLFVDDGSVDDTSALIRSILVENNWIHLIVNEENCGKGPAIRKAVSWIKGKDYTGVIAFLDADFATSPDEAIRIIRENFLKDSQRIFLFGSRVRVVSRDINRKITRQICGRLFSRIVNVMTKLPVYDFQCGFKAFSSELAYQLFDESFKTRWFFDTELFMRSRMIQDVSFIEVPLDVWIDCAGSKLKPIDFVMTLPNLFLIYMYYRQVNKFVMRKRFKYVFRD